MRVEWIIMADSAEVVNRKLYLMGGGWDRLIVHQPFPAQQLISIAVSFAVGWEETNIPHPMEIQINDEEGKQLARMEGKIEAGRPTGISPGQGQRVQLAFKLPLRFEKEGNFTVTAMINDEIAAETHFAIARGRSQRRAPRQQQQKRKLDA